MVVMRYMVLKKDQNNTLYYLFTDHLGSTSEVRSADGSLHSAQGYKAFGEVWYRMGSLPTDRTYTGQTEIEYDLLHYGARAYDPALARWVQPDTIIPQPGSPMAWDRYAYSSNNPVNYTDPTGHFPWVPLAIGAVAALYMYTSSIGLIPDVVGIAKVEILVGHNETSIEVAAGLAVQGEYAGAIDDLVGNLTEGESGYGLAQAGSKELSARGFENADPHDPNIASKVMQARIQEAQAACNGCNSFDMLVAAGIGQNGYIDFGEIKNGPSNGWKSILDKPGGDFVAQLRMFIDPSDKMFNAIILQKYVQDLRAFHKLGWNLPEGMTETEFESYLNEMEALANGE